MKQRWNLGARTAAACVLLLALAACRTSPPKPPERPSGTVRAQQLAADAGDRYEQSDEIRYERPQAHAENAMPDYPPALLAERLPERSIRARLIVDPDGRVDQVLALDSAPDAAADAFVDSVRTACARWRFSPLIERTRVPVKTTDADGTVWTEYRERERNLPFHLDYAFRFAQVDGKPSVDAQAPAH